MSGDILAAVCCPGPSLRTSYLAPHNRGTLPSYDIIIAVNRAMMLIHAHWLCAGDTPMFRGLLPDYARPSVGVLTNDDAARECRNDPTWRGLRFALWSENRFFREHMAMGRPVQWSSQAALYLAAELEATHIDIYGCDMERSGTVLDATGYRGEDRSPDRWQRETSDLELTFSTLRANRITYRRIHG